MAYGSPPIMGNDITPPDLSDSDPGLEKSTGAQIEHARVQEQHASFDDKATKRLLRKMDIRLIPFLALLYLLSFLDRWVQAPWNASAITVLDALLIYTDTDTSLAPILATLA
jgi:hypothetical protein